MKKVGKALIASTVTTVLGGGIIAGAAHSFVRTSEIQEGLLIYQHALKLKQENPNHFITADLFEIYFKEPDLTLDKYVKNFVSSPLFSIERFLLRKSNIVQGDDKTPETFPVGQNVGIWKVAERNESGGELIFDWSTSLIPFCGSTYFRVSRSSRVAVCLQFGSITAGPTEEGRNPTTLKLHELYSRVLVLSAVVKLLIAAN